MTLTYEQGAANQPVIENKVIKEKQSNSKYIVPELVHKLINSRIYKNNIHQYFLDK